MSNNIFISDEELRLKELKTRLYINGSLKEQNINQSKQNKKKRKYKKKKRKKR